MNICKILAVEIEGAASPFPGRTRDALTSLASVMDGMLWVECYGGNVLKGILPNDAQQIRKVIIQACYYYLHGKQK